MDKAEKTEAFCLLTVRQVAQRLSCSAACVYALVASGELPVVRIGLHKGYRVDIRDLDAFVRGRKFRYRPERAPLPSATFKHLRA